MLLLPLSLAMYDGEFGNSGGGGGGDSPAAAARQQQGRKQL
jgi:hypothetical protein